MLESEFLLELLAPLLDLPADSRCPPRSPVWPSLASGQRVAARTIARPFREQPACFGARVPHVASPAAHASAVRRPDVDPGELDLQGSLTALPPSEWRALKRFGQSLDRHPLELPEAHIWSDLCRRFDTHWLALLNHTGRRHGGIYRGRKQGVTKRTFPSSISRTDRRERRADSIHSCFVHAQFCRSFRR
jgi:hypothetical protein